MAQRKHLTELAVIYDAKGAAFWVPSGSGEIRCAGLLSRRGYLRAHYMGYSKPQYELTDEGRAAVAPKPSDPPTSEPATEEA